MVRTLVRAAVVLGVCVAGLLVPSAASPFALAPRVDYAVGSLPLGLATGDLDGDGDLDLVVTNILTQDVSVLLNHGDGTFADQVRFAAGGQPRSVAVGDVDGDGDLDLALGLQSGTRVLAVLLNNGAGSFSSPELHGPAPDTPDTILLAHLDADSDPDVAIVQGNAGDVVVMKGRTGATFASAATYFVPSNALSGGLAAGDVDEDGDLDLVASFIYSTGTPALLRNRGTAAFDLVEPFHELNTNTPAVAVGAIDDQSGLDIVQVSGGLVIVFPNDGTGSFGEVRTYDSPVQGSSVMRMFLADLDANGSGDLVITGSGWNQVGVVLNDGMGNFVDQSLHATGQFNGDAIAADLSADGYNDVIATNRDDHSVSILMNVSAVTAAEPELPARGLELSPLRPNPTRSTTFITYHAPHPGDVVLTVHDAAGRLVHARTDEVASAGSRTLTWDGRDPDGRQAPPGVYYLRLEMAGASATQRFVRL